MRAIFLVFAAFSIGVISEAVYMNVSRDSDIESLKSHLLGDIRRGRQDSQLSEEERLVILKGEVFIDGYNVAKEKCEAGDIETEYTRQQCLDYGYSPKRLHTCPGQKTADDFEYLCNDKHSSGYAQCLKDFKAELGWILNVPALIKNEEFRRKIEAMLGE